MDVREVYITAFKGYLSEMNISAKVVITNNKDLTNRLLELLKQQQESLESSKQLAEYRAKYFEKMLNVAKELGITDQDLMKDAELVELHKKNVELQAELEEFQKNSTQLVKAALDPLKKDFKEYKQETDKLCEKVDQAVEDYRKQL